MARLTAEPLGGTVLMVDGFVALETGGAFGLALDSDESFRRLVGVFTAGLRQVHRRKQAS